MRHQSAGISALSSAARPRRNALGLVSGLLVLATLVVGSGSPAQAAKDETIHTGIVAQISYAPNSYIIGNAYPGWTDRIQGEAQFASGPGNPDGAYYRWGHIYGPNFNDCGWIEDGQAPATNDAADACGTPQQIDTPHFRATYTNGTISPNAGDGNTATRTGATGCDTGYGNVEPWSVPATPENPRAVAGTDTLLWRYVTKDSNWVMVRDVVAAAGLPNWFFMPVGCLTLG